MNRFFTFALAGLLALTVATPAMACRCPTPTDESALAAFNDALIVARVRILQRIEDHNQPSGRIGFVYDVEREALYKGYVPKRFKIYEDGMDSCSNYFMDNDQRSVTITPATEMQGMSLANQCTQIQIQRFIDMTKPHDIYEETYENE